MSFSIIKLDNRHQQIKHLIKLNRNPAYFEIANQLNQTGEQIISKSSEKAIVWNELKQQIHKCNK